MKKTNSILFNKENKKHIQNYQLTVNQIKTNDQKEISNIFNRFFYNSRTSQRYHM